MHPIYKIVLKNNHGVLYANFVRRTKTGKSIEIAIRSNDGTATFAIPLSHVKSYEEGTYEKPKHIKHNFNKQFYKGIQLELIRRDYTYDKAKRYAIGGTNQNVWVPNKHLEYDGTIKRGENIDYVFRQSPKQLELAGYRQPMIGIKRGNMFPELKQESE